MFASAAARKRRGLTPTEVVIRFSGRAGWHFKLLPLQQRAAHPRVKLVRTSAPRYGVIRKAGPFVSPRGKLNFILSRRWERTTLFSRVARRVRAATASRDYSVTSIEACCTAIPLSDTVIRYVPTGHGTSGLRSM
jgi:hypothetical protein